MNCGQSSKGNHSGNILVYVILIVSLSFSAYTFLQQTHYENRIRHCETLDMRISQLEEKLRLFPLAFLNSLAKSASSSSSSSSLSSSPSASASVARTSDSTVPKIDIITDGDDTSNIDDSAVQQTAHIFQKLSFQVSDIHRLRRDVSHLKASRRGERQASVHPTDCSCPPGK